jgi:hypothetical protein
MAVRLSALRADRFLPPERFLVLISVRGRVDPRAIVRLEGLEQLKNAVTSSGLAMFRLVAQCLTGDKGMKVIKERKKLHVR